YAGHGYHRGSVLGQGKQVVGPLSVGVRADVLRGGVDHADIDCVRPVRDLRNAVLVLDPVNHRLARAPASRTIRRIFPLHARDVLVPRPAFHVNRSDVNHSALTSTAGGIARSHSTLPELPDIAFSMTRSGEKMTAAEPHTAIFRLRSDPQPVPF